jgi:transcriptional regulator with XRE-family HTH domain
MILPGKLLREARHRRGLTQADLARRLDTSQSVVARLESGRANPTLETFRRAIAATGHDLRVELQPLGWPPIDESLIAGNLRHTPADRIRKFSSFYRGAKSIAGAARKGDGS